MTKTPAVPDPSSVTFAPFGAESGRSPVEVDSGAALADVVAWILSPHRTAPLVVVTAGKDDADPWIDPGALAAARPDAAVYVIRNQKLTWLLADYLPAKWEVYGGGGRVYPPRIDLKSSPLTAPLVLCQGAEDAEKATGSLIDAVRRPMQSRQAPATPRQSRAAAPAPPQAVTAMGQGQAPTSQVLESPRVGVSRVATQVEAVDLATTLLDPDRRFPVVVVTNATGQAPYLDAARIAEDLDGLAEVYLLVQGEASWAFTGALPARLGVFGGAARVYPVERNWLQDETKAPLKFCWDGVGARRITTEVIEAGLSAAHSAGLLTPAAPAAKAKHCEAVVEGAMGEFHVLLKLSDGGQAAARTATIHPGVYADRLFAKGQRVSGFVDGHGGPLSQFQLAQIADDPMRRVREAYPEGAVVLAKVVETGELSAKVALHPDVEVWLLGETDGPPLSRLIDAGDVVAVQIHIDGDALQCRLPDADDVLVPAVSVLPGGPPWLVPEDLIDDEEPVEVVAPEPVPLEEAPAPAPAVQGAPDPATLGQLQAANRERALLDTRLAQAEAQVAAAKAEAAKLRRSLRDADKKAKHAVKRAEEMDDRARGLGVFSDPEAQLRHEIWLQYLHRIPESQRAELPLLDYRFGPDFIDSLEGLEGVSRDKVVDVLVEVATGLVRQIHGRQLHQWRIGPVGPQETRSDGGAAWRCSLQVNTASARRLKYWQLPGGPVEFDSVGVHDEGI